MTPDTISLVIAVAIIGVIAIAAFWWTEMYLLVWLPVLCVLESISGSFTWLCRKLRK